MPTETFRRDPTRAAIDALALRFDLPNNQLMQDWEREVADASRLSEFISAYQSGELDDDERFTLMETIIQSFDDLGEAISSDPRWPIVSGLLDTNIALHGYTVWYWSCTEIDDPEDHWAITPFLRPILDKHRAELSVFD